MKKVIGSERLPIKMWLDDIEDGALEQAKNLANLPFAFKHISIMPDCHQGYGMPIGGVLATKNIIVPNAVGVDIGCGMCTIRSNFNYKLESHANKSGLEITIKAIMKAIKNNILVGFKKHKNPADYSQMPSGYTTESNVPIVKREYENARYSLGTLGGGNHFLEFQQDKNGFIWIMIHSGSRNLGYKVAEYYNKKAIELNKRWFSSVPEKQELAFLPIDHPEGIAYLNEMNYCVEFALKNRQKMMFKCMELFKNCFLKYLKHKISFPDEIINIAHNYAALENHYGENVWVHRKGATLAREGTIGIIPGSQGTSSYIVKGKGNRESFMSCSHGAGRTMSRKKAKENLDLETEKKKLDDLGIIHSIRNKDDLEEASSAYKDIDQVMKNQEDLVEVLYELKPIAVIKG